MAEEVKRAGIDADVLEEMKRTDSQINAVLTDDTMCKRLIVRGLCELLSEFKQLHKDIDNLYEVMSVCGADKMTAFFREVSTNLQAEKTRATVRAKVSQSHKRTTKKK